MSDRPPALLPLKAYSEEPAPPPAAVPDPADVEKAARAMWEEAMERARRGVRASGASPERVDVWDEAPDVTRQWYRAVAAAALAAVRPSPDSEAVARVEAVIDGMVHELHLAKSDYVNEWQRCDALARSIDQLRAALGTGDREGQ